MEESFKKHPEVSVVVNFASFRSVYDSVMEVLEKHSEQIKTIAIIAEGVPESQTRKINKVAIEKGIGIIGPATVGGIKVRIVSMLTLRHVVLQNSDSYSCL